MKKLYFSMTLALVAMLSLTSCNSEFWNDYDSRLLGDWTSTFAHDSKGVYDLYSGEVDAYTFYDNNRGVYGYYVSRSGHSEWIEVNFRWHADRYDRVAHIEYADGKREDIYYDFDRKGCLLISRDYGFYNYIGYERNNGNSEVVGRWQSIFEVEGNNRWNIDSKKIDAYQFYYNRTGVYSYYNNNGQWTSVDFIWSDRNRRELYIRYDDDVTETIYYDFGSDGLLLSRNSDFYSYVGYRKY